jgi:ribonuclease D
MPRGILEMRGGEMLAAVERGLAVPEAQLPRFPRAQRWERDPDFDDVVARLKTVRDAAAARLDLDPGVLCPRERLEAVARRRPKSVEELSEIPELRRWQIEQLGDDFVRALRDAPSSSRKATSAGERASTSRAAGTKRDDSPYKQ